MKKMFNKYLLFFMMSVLPLSVFASKIPDSGGGMSSGELLRVLSGLIFVLLIIGFLAWIVRKLNGARMMTSSGFTLIANMNLGTKEKIILLKVGGRYLLVGVTGSSINTLHDFGEQLPETFTNQDKPSFAEIIKSKIGSS